ncbi:hypothetical protein IF1G_02545 [Cordyceps javanica]|uniref:Dimeric alpha-beta barrel n=1 Tax=Cordyceps javanica TaxID=43265 RepID=A0A545V9Q6_9HYPO|nr:hypothetical protein IF1G_02545 [Cordyceps javanica]TQW09681.1 hypothetical protein IF2G_02471 [Cordyceps javanica]
MTISEIGLLRLKPSASLEDPQIRKRLADIRAHLSSFTGHQFSYFSQVKEPCLLFLLGQWESLESHYKGMHGSDEWKQGVMEMSSYFDFQWMAHYDFRLDGLKPADASVLEVHRFLMKTRSRETFEAQLGAISGGAAGEDGQVVSGWKVDAKEDNEEYAVVLVVDGAQQRSALSERYDGLAQFAESADRHLIHRFI